MFRCLHKLQSTGPQSLCSITKDSIRLLPCDLSWLSCVLGNKCHAMWQQNLSDYRRTRIVSSSSNVCKDLKIIFWAAESWSANIRSAIIGQLIIGKLLCMDTMWLTSREDVEEENHLILYYTLCKVYMWLPRGSRIPLPCDRLNLSNVTVQTIVMQ